MTDNTDQHIADVPLSTVAEAIQNTFDNVEALNAMGDDYDREAIAVFTAFVERFVSNVSMVSGRINQRAAALLDREADRLISTAVARNGVAVVNVTDRETIADSIEKLTGAEGYRPNPTLAGAIWDLLIDRYGVPPEGEHLLIIEREDADDGEERDNVVSFRAKEQVH